MYFVFYDIVFIFKLNAAIEVSVIINKASVNIIFLYYRKNVDAQFAMLINQFYKRH